MEEFDIIPLVEDFSLQFMIAKKCFKHLENVSELGIVITDKYTQLIEKSISYILVKWQFLHKTLLFTNKRSTKRKLHK